MSNLSFLCLTANLDLGLADGLERFALPDNDHKLLRRSDCGTDSAWQPTPSAYVAVKTDDNLASWWKNISSQSHGPLPSELAQFFGSHQYGFACGIGDDSTCSPSGCLDFDNNVDPPWTYLALQSISQLNLMFNTLDAGILAGQSDYEGLIGNISEDFFSWGNG